MKNRFRIARASFFASVLSLSLLALNVFAGPPLICHAFDIDGAKSIPFVSHDWNLSGSENYDTAKLAADTIAILSSSNVTLVHMETLRRATLYARKDPVAAKQLLLQLMARAESSKSGVQPKPSAFAVFDAGYLVEAYKQWLADQNPARKYDGYALVELALQLRRNDPQMEFAAALIAVGNSTLNGQDHAQKAIDGAKYDPMLSRNLSAKFLGAQSDTLSAMILRSRIAKAN